MSIDFAVVYHAVESVLTFALIGCVGYFLAKKRWLSESTNFELSRILTLVALPAYLLYNVNTDMSKDQLASLAYGLVIPFSSVFVNVLIGVAVSRVMRIPSARIGVFRASFIFSNTIYIGLPVNLALFGEAALPYVLLYYFGNTVFFWTVGNYFLASDNPLNKTAIFSMGTLKKILSAPMVGFIFGMVLLALDIKLPSFVANACRHLGSLTTPLVLITLGVTLFNLGLNRLKLDSELFMVIFGRFVVSPLVVLVMIWIFPVPELMRKVFIIQSSLPVMSSIAMLSSFYKTDVEYATVAVSTTTLLSLFTIPFFMVFVTYCA